MKTTIVHLPLHQFSSHSACMKKCYVVGYTKHFYVGAERIATALGESGWGNVSKTLNEDETLLIKAHFERYNHMSCDRYDRTENVDVQRDTQQELQYSCDARCLKRVEIATKYNLLQTCINGYPQPSGNEEEMYYIHNDHLGSASWITNFKGLPIQYLHYAPYGELLANQAPYSYDERYKFTGKERDAETGYDFFGARYLWSQGGHWLSVDPLASDYPDITPYAYCHWQPISRIDPDGRDTLHFDANGKYTHRVQSDGSHVGIWHKSDNSTREFQFQDPNDANRFMTDEEYDNRIGEISANDRLEGIMVVPLSSVYKTTRPSISDRLKGRYIAALSGTANGSMDYMRVNEPNYNMAYEAQQKLMLVDGIPLAQQPSNMGNMLWGLKMHRLGFSLPMCLLGAHAYTIYGGITGKYTKTEFDSFDDQCSIILGFMLWPGL